jgi:hypothetical protein
MTAPALQGIDDVRCEGAVCIDLAISKKRYAASHCAASSAHENERSGVLVSRHVKAMSRLVKQGSARLAAPNSASTQSSLSLVEGNGVRLMSSVYSSQHRLELFTNILPLKMWRILHLVNRGLAPFRLRASV